MDTENVTKDTTNSPTNLSARVLYDYDAQDDDEISLHVDDVVTNIQQIDEGWWTGTNPKQRNGMFPSNYVELIEVGILYKSLSELLH